MYDFQYYTPTKVFFGRGVEKTVGQAIREYGAKKVLFHYGGGSIKRSGLYDVVIRSLQEAGLDFVELGGVEPNPKIGLVREKGWISSWPWAAAAWRTLPRGLAWGLLMGGTPGK